MKIHVVFPWCSTVRFSSKILSHLTVTHYHVTFAKLQHHINSQEVWSIYFLIFLFLNVQKWTEMAAYWIVGREKGGIRVDQNLKAVFFTILVWFWSLIRPLVVDSAVNWTKPLTRNFSALIVLLGLFLAFSMFDLGWCPLCLCLWPWFHLSLIRYSQQVLPFITCDTPSNASSSSIRWVSGSSIMQIVIILENSKHICKSDCMLSVWWNY